MNNILEQIPGLQQALAQSRPGPAEGRGIQGGQPKARLSSAIIDPAESAPTSSIQTFVFSATLTLPHSLRRRLKQGGCFLTSVVLQFHACHSQALSHGLCWCICHVASRMLLWM